MKTALNSPFKGYYPNVNPFGISPRYYGNTPLSNLYNRYKMDDSVNDKISKVKNREDANAEIEQGEIVRQDLPNGGTILHKALGKKHKNGGVPVNLPDNSFIFSDYKSTSLDKEELDTFNLGGYSKKINNRTPSKILEKNVDIENYNLMEKYLQESKDPVQKRVAQLMKAKYDEVIAKVAALQEYKKPNTNIPDFAYLLEKSPELKDEEIQTEMYEKGGMFLPKYQKGEFFKKFNPLALYIDPEKLYNPNDPEYTNSGYQKLNKNGETYGDVDKLNDYTKGWYKRVTGKEFTNKDTKSLQELYDTYHKQKWSQGYNSGINTVADGKIGNRTNAYYYDKDYLEGNKVGEIDLNEYFSKSPEEQNNIAKEYGLDPKNLLKYEKSVTAKLKIAPKGLDYTRPADPVESVNPTTPVKGENNLDKRFGDDLSWLKGYNWTPKMLSMLGNMAQYPRAYNPSLSLQQPVRFREQSLDAQPGVNDILANRYMSLKATNQYAPQSLATKQFIDSDSNKQANDYRSKIDQANQSLSTNIYNQNAQMQNQVVNSNNDRRAQYIDKMNELYQNMANERNTINATNLNLLGQGLNEQEQTNKSNDLFRRQYGWNVNQMQQSISNPEQMQTEINRINGLTLDPDIKKIMLTNLLKSYYSKNNTNPYS